MPKLPEVDAGPGRLNPNPQAEEAALRAGRLEGAFFHQIGETARQSIDLAQQHEAHQELIKGSKATSEFDVNEDILQRQIDWSQPDAVTKYRAGLEERIGNLGQYFKTDPGREFFAKWSAETRSTYGRQAIASTGDAMGIQTYQDQRETVANKQTIAGLSPSRMDEAVAGIKELYTPAHKPPLMSEEQWAAHVEQHEPGDLAGAVLTAYNGMRLAAEQQFAQTGATSDAYNQGLKEAGARHGFEYLKGEEQDQILKGFEDAKREGIADFKRNQEDGVKASVLAGDQDFLEIYHQYSELRNNGQPLPKDAGQVIRTYETAHPHNTAQSMELERFLTQDTKDEIHQTFVHSNGDVLTDFWRRAALPAGDPQALKSTEVTQAMGAGKLDKTQGGLLLKDVQERAKAGGGLRDSGLWRSKLMTWLSASLRGQLVQGGVGADGLTTGPDPSGSMAYGEAVKEALDTYQDMIEKEGLSPKKAFDTMTTEGTNRSFSQRFQYYAAARASGQPEDFFGTNPNPDAWINVSRGLQPNGQPKPVQPSASTSAGSDIKNAKGQSASDVLKANGF